MIPSSGCPPWLPDRSGTGSESTYRLTVSYTTARDTIDAIARGEIGNAYQARLDPSFKVILKKDFGESFRIVVDKHNPALLKSLDDYISGHADDVGEKAKSKLIDDYSPGGKRQDRRWGRDTRL